MCGSLPRCYPYIVAHELALLWLNVDAASNQRWEVCYNMDTARRPGRHTSPGDVHAAPFDGKAEPHALEDSRVGNRDSRARRRAGGSAGTAVLPFRLWRLGRSTRCYLKERLAGAVGHRHSQESKGAASHSGGLLSWSPMTLESGPLLLVRTDHSSDRPRTRTLSVSRSHFRQAIRISCCRARTPTALRSTGQPFLNQVGQLQPRSRSDLPTSSFSHCGWPWEARPLGG